MAAKKPQQKTNQQVRKVVVFARHPQGGNRIIYGTLESHDKKTGEAVITNARMCIYYPSGGELGLATVGPPPNSRLTSVNPLAPRVEVLGVVQVADATEAAQAKWEAP